MKKTILRIFSITGFAIIASSYFIYAPVIPIREFRPFLIPICFLIGSAIIPLILGILVAAQGQSSTHHLSRTQQYLLSLSSFVLYLISMMIIEILLYHPWRPAILPDGGTYNRYSLNALYFSPFAFLVLVIWAAGFGAQIAFRYIKKRKKTPIQTPT